MSDILEILHQLKDLTRTESVYWVKDYNKYHLFTYMDIPKITVDAPDLSTEHNTSISIDNSIRIHYNDLSGDEKAALCRLTNFILIQNTITEITPAMKLNVLNKSLKRLTGIKNGN